MSSGGGDSEPASAKKKGRGPTTITRVVNHPNKAVEFDKLGRLIINEKTTSYLSQLGILVRANIPIRYREWSDVPNFIKKKIWHDIQLAWKLPEQDDLKKEVTQRMAVHYRRFINTLNNNYVKEGKTPFKDYTSITPDDWDAFVEYHQSKEFQALSEQGKANQSNNLFPHFLGSRGYRVEKFQERLKETLKEIAKPGSQSDLSSCGSTSDLLEEQIIDMSVEHRHVSRKLAREKMLDDGEYVYPNPETKAMIKTTEEQEEAFNQGMLIIDRHDDILGKSLPNSEHSGRVRGVGSLVGIKKTYAGCGKRKRDTFSESEVSIEQRIKRAVDKIMKPVEEAVERQMTMLMDQAFEMKMTMLMGQQMNKENPLASSPGVVQSQSSCPSVQPTHFLDSVEVRPL